MANPIEIPVDLQYTGNSKNLLAEIQALKDRTIKINLQIVSPQTRRLEQLEKTLIQINRLADVQVKVNLNGIDSALSKLGKIEESLKRISGSSGSALINSIEGSGSRIGPYSRIHGASPLDGLTRAERNQQLNANEATARSADEARAQEARQFDQDQIRKLELADEKLRNLDLAAAKKREIEQRKVSRVQKELNTGSRSAEFFLAGLGPGGAKRREDFLREEEVAQNLTPGALKGTNQTPFFNGKRLLNKEVATQLTFAGLFGGPASFIGGAIGGATPLGATGALLGSVVGQKFNEEFEKLKDSLIKAAEAGFQFERSIVGIAAVLQTTSRLTGTGGQDLNVRDQISFQTKRATAIQLEARSKLLPLGIGGQQETALVQAVVAGASQKGISLTPEQVARISQRFGAAALAQRPELLQNPSLIRRDIEDILSGVPQAQRTALGSTIRPVIQQIAKATTGDELDRATAKLQAFVDAIKNSDQAFIGLQKVTGAFDNLQTILGRGLVSELVPGFNALAESLSNPELLKNLQALGQELGALGNNALKAAAGFATEANKQIPEYDSILRDPGFQFGATGVASILGGLAGAVTGNPVPLLLATLGAGTFFSVINNTPSLNDQKEENDDKDLAEKRSENNRILGRKQNKLLTRKEVNEARLAELYKNPISDKNNAEIRDIKQDLDDISKDLIIKEHFTVGEGPQVNPVTALTTLQDKLAKLKTINALQVSAVAGIGISGQEGKIDAEIKGFADQTANLKQQLNAVSEAEKEDIQLKIDTIAATKEELENKKALLELQKELLQTDQGTFSGKKAAARIRANEIRKANPGIDDSALNSGLNRELTQLDISSYTQTKNYANAENNIESEISGLNDALASLRENVVKSSNTLYEFYRDEELRQFGRTGQLVSAAEKFYAAGGTNLAEPFTNTSQFTINSLAKGSSSFNAASRAQFEIEQSQKEFTTLSDSLNPEQVRRDEVARGEELSRGVNASDLALRKFPQTIQDTIDAFKILRINLIDSFTPGEIAASDRLGAIKRSADADKEYFRSGSENILRGRGFNPNLGGINGILGAGANTAGQAVAGVANAQQGFQGTIAQFSEKLKTDLKGALDISAMDQNLIQDITIGVAAGLNISFP